MNEYLMTYYRGRDRDDWREEKFLAYTLDLALEHALDCATMELCPSGWTVKIVELLKNQ